MSYIVAEGLTKIYGSGDAAVIAADDISFQIEEGAFIGIMGESGSGKSTLLGMMGAMNAPTSGRFIVDDIDIYTLGQEQRADFRREFLGFIFQSFHLLPRLTALENVLLPRRYHEKGLREFDRQRASELLRRVDLDARADHRPNELSGGQRQRVAIARALINQPRVVLADEPTGNLDSKTSDAIMDLLQELNQDGQTIVMVTHEADIANYASRQIFMQDGRIQREAA